MDRVLILDFGSQYNQLIARRIRSLKVYSEIKPFSMSLQEIREWAPRAIVLSGGPASVSQQGAPSLRFPLSELKGIPILGICYGMQTLVSETGGKVAPSPLREYGRAIIKLLPMPDLTYVETDTARSVTPSLRGSHEIPLSGPQLSSPSNWRDSLFEGCGGEERRFSVWMSHGDSVAELPKEWAILARSANSPHVAIAHQSEPWFGVQFHPEVVHTENGTKIIENFVKEIAGCRSEWKMSHFVEETIEGIRSQVGEKGKVLCGISGGIDSTVAALLLHRAIGNRLKCIFVDNGLLRSNEAKEVESFLNKSAGIQVSVVDASDRFLEALKGVTDPEEKRKVIGKIFIDVFFHSIQKEEEIRYLAQGTLYPDVIESQSVAGPSHTIKSHHNVGGLPAELPFKLVEPLRSLFKDEVREVASTLGLPQSLISRQPFPGPGLAVRILGEVTPEGLEILRKADAIVREVIEEPVACHPDPSCHPEPFASLEGKLREGSPPLWQWFAVLLPVKSVGVMGDARTYENVVAVRVVTSADGMTADWAPLPPEVLQKISNRIINEVRGVNRVVYDISSKPPSTIEWE